MDGKQARKTGTSSALGMLFDHGCDGFVSGMIPLILTEVAGFNGPSALAVQGLSGLFFLAKTLEQKAEGRLVLGFINPVDEGLPLISVILISSGIIGNQIWTTPSFLFEIKWNVLLLWTYLSFGVPFLISSIIAILKIKGPVWLFQSLASFLSITCSCFMPMLSLWPDSSVLELPMMLNFLLLSGRIIVS